MIGFRNREGFLPQDAAADLATTSRLVRGGADREGAVNSLRRQLHLPTPVDCPLGVCVFGCGASNFAALPTFKKIESVCNSRCLTLPRGGLVYARIQQPASPAFRHRTQAVAGASQNAHRAISAIG